MGRVDIVTPHAIYEVKHNLTLAKAYTGIGQLTIYSLFFPDRQKILATNKLTKHLIYRELLKKQV